VDLIVAEGYKNAAIPKVEVFRAAVSDSTFISRGLEKPEPVYFQGVRLCLLVRPY
jgi:molybdopterin-guanine dinucleotide biosynthesis protein